MAVRWAADMAPPMAKTTGAKFTVSPGFSGPKGPERDHKATTKRHLSAGHAGARGGRKRGKAAGRSIDKDRPEKLLFWKGNRRVWPVAECQVSRGEHSIAALGPLDLRQQGCVAFSTEPNEALTYR